MNPGSEETSHGQMAQIQAHATAASRLKQEGHLVVDSVTPPYHFLVELVAI